MARVWAAVWLLMLSWALSASCSLDIGAVRKPSHDGGGGGGGDADHKDGSLYTLPTGCLSDLVLALCDPRTNAGCSGGFGCDTTFYTQPTLACLPNDNVPLGGTCNEDSGPFCAPKLVCSGIPGFCTTFCCFDKDCPGGYCIPFDPNLGTLGHCSNVPDAGKAG